MLRGLLSVLLVMFAVTAFSQPASAAASIALAAGTSATGTVSHVTLDANGTATAYQIKDEFGNKTDIVILEENQTPTNTTNLINWWTNEPQIVVTACYNEGETNKEHCGFELGD